MIFRGLMKQKWKVILILVAISAVNIVYNLVANQPGDSIWNTLSKRAKLPERAASGTRPRKKNEMAAAERGVKSKSVDNGPPDVLGGPAKMKDLEGVVPISPIDKLDTHLRLNCSKCAYVSNSGHLLGAGIGHVIDTFPCVIRMNDAPTRSYEKDVGSKTTVRIVSHYAIQHRLSLQKVKREDLHLLQGEEKPEVIIPWGPAGLMAQRSESSPYGILKNLSQEFGISSYLLKPEYHSTICRGYEIETGVNASKTQSWMSTGWITMVLARAACGEIFVYGMVEEDHCRNHPHSRVPYHYYEPEKVTECREFSINENFERAGHRFGSEKTVFGRWSELEPRIHFAHPNWP